MLRAAPTEIRENRAEVIRKRLFYTMLTLFLVGTPVMIVALEWLPTDGLGYPLYWVHDHIYLPFQGWTYHAFAPASSIWWTLIALFGITWLIFFLVDESLVLSPHRDLALAMVRRPRHHARLLAVSTWLARRGFQPALLRTAVAHETENTLLDLERDPGTEPDRLGALTLLTTRLALLPGADQPDRMRALAAWLAGYRALLARDVTNKRWWPDLMAAPADLAHAWRGSADPSPWQEMAISGAADLTPESLFLDALLLASCHDRATAERLLDPALVKRPLEERRQAVCTYLGEACETRRVALSAMRIELQQRALRPVSSAEPEPPLAEVEETHLPMLGRATLDASIALSRLTGRPGPGQSMLETLDALTYALALFDEVDEETEPALAACLVRYRALVASAPTAADYRRCAESASRYAMKRREALARSAAARDDLVQTGDLALTEERIELLLHGAGPGYERGSA